MSAARRILVGVLLAALAAAASGCVREIGGARVSARVGTRIPGVVYSQGDGTPAQIEPVDPPGDAVFLIVRGRY